MSEIRNITAREFLDSRGNPTLEAEVTLASGATGTASVPSGISTGTLEAVELRDGDLKRYRGMGVLKAVCNVSETIFQELEGCNGCDQLNIDRTLIALDGTPNKERLGANATLSVSIAAARAAANELKVPLYRYLGGSQARILPLPMFNLINGGAHSGAPTAIQEFMIRPVCAESFSEALEIAVALFNTLKTMLKERGLSCAVGDEGGFVPALPGGTEDILDLMMLATEKTGFAPGEDIRIALDCASSEYFNGESYDYTVFEGERGAIRTQAEQIEYLEKLIKSYPVDSIEDGMAENDWQGWKAMTSLLGEKCQLVGDDIFVTNPGLLQKGIDNAVGNAILIKPNQIGTLTETFETIELAKKFGYLPIISHRSGETSDTAIADIAVASGAGQIKAGSVSRGERIVKYNRLLQIERELEGNSIFGF